MAIGTAAAIIGSAVVGAGASALSSRSAANKAADASKYAADQNAQVSREIYNQTRNDLAPYNQAGQGALSALMVRLGITPTNATGAPPPSSYGGQPQPQPAPAATFNKTPGGPAGTTPAQPIPGRDDTRQVGRPFPDLISSVTGQGAPTAQGAPGGVDYAKLATERPDLKAQYDKVIAQADRNSPWFKEHGLDRGFDGFADWWLKNQNPGTGYNPPMTSGTPAAPAQGQVPAGQTPQYFQETYAQRPDALAVPTFQRPKDLQAPGAFSWDPSQIAKDKGFQFETKQTTENVNAGSAARGMLRSGDAAKALQDRLFGVAHTYGNDYFNRATGAYDRNQDAYRFAQGRQDANFIDDRSYGTNLWNQQQGRADNIFSEDRGFQAGRFDQGTSNLFGLMGAGQNAAAQQGNAGNVFASNVINSNNQRANTTANAALANGQNMSNLFGSAAGALGTYYGMRGRI